MDKNITEHHRRKFLSLKWKALALTSLVLISVSISHTTLNHMALVKQFETQGDITHKQYIVQIEGLIERSSKRLQQLGGMLPILSGMKKPLITESTTALDDVFSQHWPSLQIDIGVGLVRFYTKSNKLLGTWGDIEDSTPVSSTILGKVWYANERELPVSAMDCSVTCIQYTAVPMLADGQNIGVVLLGQSMADVILGFKQVSGTDIGIVTTRSQSSINNDAEPGKWISQWNADVTAITSPAKTLDILHASAIEAQTLSRALNSTRTHVNGRDYNVRLISLNGMEGGERTHLAVITDITEELARISRDTTDSWTTAIIGLLLMEGLLLILMWTPMSRLRRTSLRLPLLSERKFEEARADIKKSHRWQIFDDETDVLDKTAVDLSFHLEQLENESDTYTNALTERAEELAVQKDFVTNLLDTAQAIIITQDNRGEITMLNQYCEKLMGYDQGELLSYPFLRLISSDNISTIVIRDLSDLVTGKIKKLHHELTITCKDGTRRDIAWFHSYSQRHENGEATVLSVGIDITDRKKAEIHARAAHYEKVSAEAANHSKSAFLANMSHEIRTPLTAIIGFSEAMLDTKLSPSERENTIKTIIRSGRHLQNVINDILDLSKVEAGKLDVEPMDISPFELMEDVKPLVYLQAKEKKLKFSVNYEFPIPEKISSDKLRLKQILINLCNNAVKFTSSGSISVNISCHPEANIMEFRVIDTGIGLSPNQKDLIFEAFSQADSTTTRKYGGTGLGLYLSKQLANKLGGDITVDSKPGLGSTFLLTIDTGPLDSVALLSSTPAITQDAVQRSGAEQTTLSGRILLAEDNADNQRLIAMKVEQTGVEMSIADNGKIAVQMALQNPYDLILMDIQMPVMNGFDAIKMLRDNGYSGTIVALTANAMNEDIEACIEAGSDGFLAKPIDWDKFFKVLNDNLSPEKNTKTPLVPIKSTLIDGNPKMQELVERYIECLPDQLDEIKNLYQLNDFNSLKELIHTIKGTAGNYGFLDLTNIAATINAELNNENYTDIESHFSEIDTIYERIKLGR
jgi:PAS domain S-box-containing protein